VLRAQNLKWSSTNTNQASEQRSVFNDEDPSMEQIDGHWVIAITELHEE
jgi:hypothetical protein